MYQRSCRENFKSRRTVWFEDAQIALVNARVRNVEEATENDKQRLLFRYESDLSAANDKIKKLETI